MPVKKLCGENWRHEMKVTEGGWKACIRCGTLARKGVPGAVRFWSHVKKGPGCWIWTGAFSARGYGVYQAIEPFRVNTCASKVAWFYATGEWPSVYMLHKCDNTACVRPDHLFPGTQKENMEDKVRKGRWGARALPIHMVTEVRRLAKEGMSNVEIAQYLHLSRERVYRITSGRCWSSLKVEA